MTRLLEHCLALKNQGSGPITYYILDTQQKMSRSWYHLSSPKPQYGKFDAQGKYVNLGDLDDLNTRKHELGNINQLVYAPHIVPAYIANVNLCLDVIVTIITFIGVPLAFIGTLCGLCVLYPSLASTVGQYLENLLQAMFGLVILLMLPQYFWDRLITEKVFEMIGHKSPCY